MAEETVACIGAGNVGRAWAIAFARGRKRVNVFDTHTPTLERCVEIIAHNLADLEAEGLVKSAGEISRQIHVSSSLEEAVAGASHIQESIKEDLDLKRQIFAELDQKADGDAVIASSSSEFRSSQFINEVKGVERCLVAHPINPPYLIPLVEISGHPKTSSTVIARTRTLFEEIGMSPVLLEKEIKGFLLNRLQAAVIGEALHLVGEGYCTAEDLDRAMTDGLGLRWAFMGPFLTGHLNATDGYRGYIRNYANAFKRMTEELNLTTHWASSITDAIAEDLEKTIPIDQVENAQRWRDKRLMGLLKHRKNSPNFKR